MDGLKQILGSNSSHISTLAEAQFMEAKVDLQVGLWSHSVRSGGSGSRDQKTKIKDKNKGKGAVGMVEGGSSSKDITFFLVEKENMDGLQKKGKAAKKQWKQ